MILIFLYKCAIIIEIINFFQQEAGLLKQFQFEYQNFGQFKNELIKIKQWESSHIVSKIVFQVYSTSVESSIFIKIFETIDEILPDAVYLGCSSNGNIIDGKLSKSDTIVICTVFEYPSTKVKILQYDMGNPAKTAEKLADEVNKNSWVKAIELLVTMRGKSMTDFCEYMTQIREDVEIFGGGAFTIDMSSNRACVYSKTGGYSEDGVVFMLLGGEDLNIESTFITGWKPLGRNFKVTSADGFILRELDGKPAYDAYYKYLKIKNDENFFYNTLEFPFLYKHNGIDLLRAPVRSFSDGSLEMTSDIEEDVNARIAYGDPWTVLSIVNDRASEIEQFQPEVIHIFSCAGRRTFWGEKEVSKETIPFQQVAPTSGFFTSGEFLRTGKYLDQHNVTLVVASMREGEKIIGKKEPVLKKEDFSGKVSMVNRLATFIEAATEELEDANKRLELAVVTDGLTHLLNRSEITRITREAFKNRDKCNENICLVMLDIDNFKKVNDTCGHKEGDNVIIALSDILRKVSEDNENVYSGRWGGEEFMILFKGYDTDKVADIAENIRKEFAETKYTKSENKTVSIGIIEIEDNEAADNAYVRVDSALYNAKKNGKNRVVVFRKRS